MKRTARLKQGAGGWFAAGAGFERALSELSDPAFKLFAQVCLRAERASGCLDFERAALARELGKSRSTLGRCLRELASKGVCDLEAAANPHRGSRLRVRPEYWPCERREELERRSQWCAPDGGEADTNVAAYVARVRGMFRQPACVQGEFGPADERLAADWHRAGVSLETLQRAILLGSVRKSMTLIDRPDSEPVRRLAYFESLLEEVRSESFPVAYWQHLEFNLGRCERYWRDKPATAPGRARPNLEQAGSPGAAATPSSATGRERNRETG